MITASQGGVLGGFGWPWLSFDNSERFCMVMALIRVALNSFNGFEWLRGPTVMSLDGFAWLRLLLVWF